MAQFTLTDLVQWSENLPVWQRDALRRVVEKGRVMGGDIDQLVKLAKEEASTGSCPGAVPASDILELPVTESRSIRLTAVREIARVNALAAGPVRFSPEGLTVFYGGNATGKSGLVRILKKACRARDPGGPIRANVFEADSGAPASATIDFLVGDAEKSFTWVDAIDSNPELNEINVFDTRSAAVQVEEPNFVSYTPAVLYVFRLLAEAIDQVATRLRDEKSKLGEQPVALSNLQLDPDTAAGEFLTSLGPRSKSEDLERLCVLTEEEATELATLDRALAEEPLGRAQQEEGRARRIDQLDALAGEVFRLLSDEACNRFARLLERRNSALSAADAARTVFARSAVVAGVGTEAWRALWEAARRYSEAHAFPGEPFPVVREDAVCVLCQRALDDRTSRRLASFEEFVRAEVQREADDATRDLDAVGGDIRSLSLLVSVSSSLKSEGLIATEEGQELRRYLIVAKLRRRHLLRQAIGRTVGALPQLPPRPDLAALSSAIRQEVERLRTAAGTEERRAMMRQRAELQNRKRLAEHRSLISAEIERLKAIQSLDSTLAISRTQPVTLKARQAANAIITNQLRTSFADNLAAIGFTETPVEVRIGAGEHGEHPYEMTLTPRPEVPPVEILSEGERTCVALAGFLAELKTTGNRSAIVLDDPVSSLDHRYRKRVAERIVREAKERQVIVLTHDVVFLYLLRKYGRELGVAVTENSLERGYKRDHGRPTDGPPWIAMLVKARISRLRDDLAGAREALKAGDRPTCERKIGEIYRRLRQTWERAVEEVLLYETVVRFGDSVQTQRLRRLTDISDADVEMVTKEMSRCSDFVHDEAGAVNAEIPEPGVVEADISRIHEWIRELRSNRGRG